MGKPLADMKKILTRRDYYYMVAAILNLSSNTMQNWQVLSNASTKFPTVKFLENSNNTLTYVSA